MNHSAMLEQRDRGAGSQGGIAGRDRRAGSQGGIAGRDRGARWSCGELDRLKWSEDGGRCHGDVDQR